jgi:parallel beta-helix repeat protein
MWRQRVVLALTLAVAALVFGAGQAFAGHRDDNDGGHGRGGRQLLVDDDGVQCPGAQYRTAAGIQLAIDAARPGDTIVVCPGAYTGTTVPKSLTVLGSTRPLDSAGCLDRTRGQDPLQDAIVNGGPGTPGFRIGATDVTIAGFTVQGTSNDGGIAVPAAFSGTRILKNLIQDNTMGVYLNSSGRHESRVEGNCIRDNDVPGSAAGNGVYSDQGLADARIRGNSFTGHVNAAVILVGPAGSQENLSIDGNSSSNDGPLIFANLTDSSVSGNQSLASGGSGIFFAGGSHNVWIRGNTVLNCAFTGINVRFDPAGYPVATPNRNLLVDGNQVSACGDSGIRLRDGTTTSLVRRNTVSSNGLDGIGVEAANQNRVESNTSADNGRDGMHVDQQSAGNRIVGNTMQTNGRFDCDDETGPGPGTAGTLNFWFDDQGVTQNRPGLCSPRRRGGGDPGGDDE